MTRVLSSRVLTAFFKPVSASVKLMSIFMIRSCKKLLMNGSQIQMMKKRYDR